MYAPADLPPAEDQALELDGPPRESIMATPHSRRPSVELDFELEGISAHGNGHLQPGGLPPPRPAPSGAAYFEPLGPEDVYDVFDLELALQPGGKVHRIRHRRPYRSSDSSSGRPTYKIQKKTKAHLFGKKNMNVEVTRSLGWDSMSATPTLNGSKGYTNVFVARDQQSRNVALSATNSVLSKSVLANTVTVSSACGMYDPARTPRRESAAHHFFALRLNELGDPEPAFPQKSKRTAAAPPPPPAPSAPKAYAGGGHFVLDSAPHGRTDLLTTIYCTGYDQRPVARAGDIVVAELRVRPAGPGAPPTWARFFKERHAALHVARRGLDACMTGPHVKMRLPGADGAGLPAVLSRGQALEVVLAALGTALLAIEHDGLEAKRWAWLVHPQQQLVPRAPKPAVSLALGPAPAADDNPGWRRPTRARTRTRRTRRRGEPGVRACERAAPPPGAGCSSVARGTRRASRSGAASRTRGASRSRSGAGSSSRVDRRGRGGRRGVPVPVPMQHMGAHAEAPRGGTWARKSSIISEHAGMEVPAPRGAPWGRQIADHTRQIQVPEYTEDAEMGVQQQQQQQQQGSPPLRALGPHHHLKAGSWPQKNRQSMAPFEPLVASVPEPQAPAFRARAAAGRRARAKRRAGMGRTTCLRSASSPHAS
ncbi:hypothetical protein B0H17DRAFT_1213824 [Mycena rosella]|uniref:Uncharacterized protein n=1 Tax=Mycena rosella TaxID=1033263 RepID=A0AAD7CQ32_MYCRO|nr:hypothetical protein B0H17DRAFT_1213824 [Mycena rosella]